MGLAFIGAASHLNAQRVHQFEFSGFASFTRYDRAFALKNQIGGGARVGYFLTNGLGGELDAGYQSPNPRTGTASPTLALGSASLVLNFGSADQQLFYILGGFTRLDFQKSAPYRFTDNAAHAAIGDRVFLGRWGALRVEARGIYAPSTGFAGADWAGHVVGSLGLSVFTGGGGGVSDLDHDGVPDPRDACPSTPAGAMVDAKGCPSDTDGDGVPDGIDKCPNTPRGVEVDSVGCQRFRDSDGDGVDDSKDKCPGTPSGMRVDAAGCPILFTPERTPVILRGVVFETGKSILKPESYTVLDIVAQSLLANPDIRIEVAGYTDITGSAALNLRLSRARADAVRTYLARKGVAPSRMIARGYGPGNPIAPNTTTEGRALNRRVELHQLP